MRWPLAYTGTRSAPVPIARATRNSPANDSRFVTAVNSASASRTAKARPRADAPALMSIGVTRPNGFGVERTLRSVKCLPVWSNGAVSAQMRFAIETHSSV